MKVLVLMGGISLERDVSLASGKAVCEALRRKGYQAIALDTAENSKFALEDAGQLIGDIKTKPPDIVELDKYNREQNLKILEGDDIWNVDVVFLAFHGGAGEDGTIQALLEMADVRYTGSKVLASALAMNKAISKKLFERDGIITPDWMLIKKKEFDPEDIESIIDQFPPPVIIKPNDQGSTVGLALVENEQDYLPAIEAVLGISGECLIEEYIEGRELTVAVLDDRPLPAVEILPKNKLYDYECKYTTGMCSYVCPADISDAKTAEIQELGLRAFKALNCDGYARVDFRMDLDGKLYCLEVNTLPGMTGTSLVPKAAKAVGISFDDLVDKIVKLAVDS